MKRPTLSLCLIAKNEEKNVPQLFRSIEGCFDEIVFVDTGSTDRTIDAAKFEAELIETPIKIEHFTWINDFSAARNFAFDHATTDFVMWLDLDDVLKGQYEFIKWRDTAMEFCDYWLANYDYAFDDRGNPMTTFMRERVFRRSKNPRFNYFIHEGVQPSAGVRIQMITTWRVEHKRTTTDLKQDRNRNLSILEQRKGELDSRLTFYYGKELYEAEQFERALGILIDASSRADLGHDDRILSIQYACYASMGIASKMMPAHREEHYARARQLAHQGLQIAPNRAEFFNIIAESYLYADRMQEALPFLNAQEKCQYQPPGGKYSGAIFSFEAVYTITPKIQKAQAYLKMGLFDEARKEAEECLQKFSSQSAADLLNEMDQMKSLFTLDGPKIRTEDIVFTCPPDQAYPFDEEIYKTKGLGGSETALIQVAKWLKKLTGRSVKVFNLRDETLVSESGVEYIPNSKLNQYFTKYEPAVHVAWRHNIKLTEAQTYLWCHDLVTPGVEIVQNFDQMLCLTPFHREYVHSLQGLPYDKIITTRNGIDPEKFKFARKAKNPNKVVWMSSPDRGLDRCMKVLDLVRQNFPEIELHVYYGLDNLYKYGLSDMANNLKKMMSDRPWVKYHGFTEQSKMYQDVSDAVIWLHPCDFIETYCITAIEMLALGIYPVTRRLGGLKDTLRDAEGKGMAFMLDRDCVTEEDFLHYAAATRAALEKRVWENVQFDPNKLSWRGLAEEWIRMMDLSDRPKTLAPLQVLKETTA